jgi:transcriptional regulator with PAS, ATPase and Fis domain
MNPNVISQEENYPLPISLLAKKRISQKKSSSEKEEVAVNKNLREIGSKSQNYGTLLVVSEGLIDSVGCELCSLFGLKPKDLLGKNISGIIPNWAELHKALFKETKQLDIETDVHNIPNSGRYKLIANLYKSNDDGMDGVVLSFRCMKCVMSEVNRYVGNHAKISFADIFAEGSLTKRLVKEAKQIGANDTHALLVGNKHTGKEAFAQAIHNHSARSEYGFVAVDLSSTPQEEMEEVLFGYVESYKPHLKRKSKYGAIELANGGTLYINEIGLLPHSIQTKLINVLITGNFQKLGDDKPCRVDIRVIASSSLDIIEEKVTGLFQNNHFSHFGWPVLKIPSLSERKNDISLFLKHYLYIKSKELNKNVPSIPRNIELILKRYAWPDNIKELKELCEFIVIDEGKMFTSFRNEREFKQKYLYIERQKSALGIRRIEDVERESIINAYNILGGSISKAAKKLGISRNTLYLKFNKYHSEGYI